MSSAMKPRSLDGTTKVFQTAQFQSKMLSSPHHVSVDHYSLIHSSRVSRKQPGIHRFEDNFVNLIVNAVENNDSVLIENVYKKFDHRSDPW